MTFFEIKEVISEDKICVWRHIPKKLAIIISKELKDKNRIIYVRIENSNV